MAWGCVFLECTRGVCQTFRRTLCENAMADDRDSAPSRWCCRQTPLLSYNCCQPMSSSTHSPPSSGPANGHSNRRDHTSRSCSLIPKEPWRLIHQVIRCLVLEACTSAVKVVQRRAPISAEIARPCIPDCKASAEH